MRRSFKFPLRPTRHQEIALTGMLADHCTLYNAALQERRDAYTHPSKTRIRYGDQSAQLKEIRTADPDGQGRWSFTSQQQTLRRLNKAFEAFFRRVKAGQAPGHPRFKPRQRYDTVTFVEGDGAKWDSQPHHPTATYVKVHGIGHLRVHQHRPVAGRVKSVEVKREGKQWYVILSCDEVPGLALPQTGSQVGIDVGITHFLTDSRGEHAPNPRHGRKAAPALAEAQRTLQEFPKKVKAAKRTRKHRTAAAKVTRLYAKVRRQRLDHAHKTALKLVRAHDVIAHEKLNLAAMVKSPKPKPDPDQPGVFLPNGAAAKAGLNKAIHDAGWGVFLGILAGKAESAGRVLIPVNPRNTSRTCPRRTCGHICADNRDKETFCCVKCGYTDHADRVGAYNVALRAGLALPDVA